VLLIIAMVLNNICIFASELAVITGHNPYQKLNDIYLKLWKKHYPEDYDETVDKYETKTNSEVIEETKEESVTRIAKSNNILSEVSVELEKCLKTQDVAAMNKLKTEILKKCDAQVKTPKDRKLIKECVSNIANTNFGTKHENSAVIEYQKQTGDNVNMLDKFLKKSLYKTKTNVWMIGGRVDGLNDDNVVIEIKNRVNKLFYKLRDYEKVQTYAYMYILDTQKAKLVESFKQKNSITINVIDVEYEEDYWNSAIDSKIKTFIKSFEKMMRTEQLKMDLIGELFGPHS
jgi:hypothetical protein